MENSKAVSEYVFEDEFSFATDEGEIYRKECRHQPTKKLDETDLEQVEEKIADFKGTFASLKEEIESLEAVSEDEAEEWRSKLQQSRAIGDFDQLYDKLDDLTPLPEEEDTEDEAPADNDEDEAEADNPVAYYKELTKEAQEVSHEKDWQAGARKLDELSHRWSDGPEVEGEEAEEEVKDLYYKFTKSEERFQNRREESRASAERERKENLSKKKQVVTKVEKIVKKENWSATGQIKQLQNRWHGIGQVPKEEASDLKQTYHALIKEFKSHKVDRVVEKRQTREDNLMMKMAVLDKMENVAGDMDHETENWDEIEETFSDLTRQWKKIGRVPRKKSNKVWDRYKSAQDAYYDEKYKYDKDHRSNVDSFTAKKGNVIDDAEALMEQDDIAKAARKVNKLHRRWKKIGNLPQRKEDELWDRFKAATDAFNEKKANNQDEIKAQEEEHYQKKLKLIEKAEEIKGTDDWDKGHQTMQSLMGQWKKIGPVPRKKSGKIWKQFKGAMDVFYDRRREHFKEAKEQQKENLKKKQEILDKLHELGRHEDPIKAVDEAKKLQEQFKDVGYVPIKRKNEMWKKYREACDVIYDRMRAAKSGSKFDQELAKADLDPEQRSQIQDLRKKFSKVKKQVRSLKKEVLQMEESKANFNFSGEDNPLLKQFDEKISKAQAKLDAKENKMEALSMEMEDIREEA